ncbi:MAG: helix-turn-helix domain-containing protein [Chloroflexota bacterium]|nr:helix-turn-helix domain-containing protein [Chloroflexota bacterium]
MNERDENWLGRLLTAGESERVEFKEQLGNESLETVAAFANTRGGTLLIGVADDGTVEGVTLGKESLRDWANRIAQATRVHPQILPFPYQGRTVMVLEVPESPLKPVPCRGRYFKRVGSSNRQMTDDDLTRAVLGSVGMTWDEAIEPRATLDDLNLEQMQRFRKLCNLKGRRSIPSDEENLAVLEKLGLLQEGNLNRAAVLLFGRNPQRFYPQARVRVGRFRAEAVIVDDREIVGTLFDQVEAVMAYFRERLQTRFAFHDAAARDVLWEYPLEALREAIINAVCHRDYLDNGHVQVRWRDERIVFLNPGGLPEPLRVEDLKREHRSVLRNRKIAEVFFYAGFIEQWGSGTLRMIRECVEASLPEPEFEERQEALWVTFRKDILTKDHLQAMGLKERPIKAMLFAREQGRVTNRDYRQLNQVSNKTAYLELGELMAKGLLKRQGAGKAVEYILVTG